MTLVDLDVRVSHLGTELGELKAEGLVERHGITAVQTISTSAAGSYSLETAKSDIAG